MKKFVLIVILSAMATLSAQAQSTTTIPNTGHKGSLERWLKSNKIDSQVAEALRVCENNVDETQRKADPSDVREVVPFKSNWQKSCDGVRAKAIAAEATFKASKAQSDKDLVDSIANK